MIISRVFAEQGINVSAKEAENIKKQNTSKEIRSTDGRFIDNKDGTIVDTKTNLIWTKADSYAELGKCLSWEEAKKYVSSLRTGGYSDWRMPAVKELKSIFETLKSNKDKDGNTIHMDPIFAPVNNSFILMVLK